MFSMMQMSVTLLCCCIAALSIIVCIDYIGRWRK